MVVRRSDGMKKSMVIGMATIILLVGCSRGEESKDDKPSEIEQVNATVQDTEVIAKNLDVPWDVIKENGAFFISQRGGTIVQVTENGEKVNMPLRLDREVVHRGEGGLLGFVLHPNYEDNQNAYVYHTYEERGRRQNRVVLVKKVNGAWEERAVLLEGIPGSNIHNGGRLEVGPDKMLYVNGTDKQTHM